MKHALLLALIALAGCSDGDGDADDPTAADAGGASMDDGVDAGAPDADAPDMESPDASPDAEPADSPPPACTLVEITRLADGMLTARSVRQPDPVEVDPDAYVWIDDRDGDGEPDAWQRYVREMEMPRVTTIYVRESADQEYRAVFQTTQVVNDAGQVVSEAARTFSAQTVWEEVRTFASDDPALLSGRVPSAVDYVVDDTLQIELRRTFEGGRIVRETYDRGDDGPDGVIDLDTRFEYADGQVTRFGVAEMFGCGPQGCMFEADGAEKRQQWDFDETGDPARLQAGRPVRMRIDRGPAAGGFEWHEETAYTYDTQGNLVRAEISDLTGGTGERVTEWRYDCADD